MAKSVKKDESITKELEATEYIVQSERVLAVLDNCIQDVEFVELLPSIFENLNIMEQFLSSEGTTLIKNVLSKYSSTPSTSSVVKEEVTEDPEIACMLEMILSCNQLKEYMETHFGKCDPTIKHFTIFLKDLREFFKKRFAVSGLQEKENEERLRQIYLSNIFYVNEKEELLARINKMIEEMSGSLQQRKKEMDTYSENIKQIQNFYQEEIKKYLYTSLKKMNDRTVSSEEKQESLSEKAELSKNLYERTKEDNLLEEKKLRAKRLKIEAQLSSWLFKFDQDVGEKFSEYEKLKKQYDKKFEQMTKLKEKIKEQEILFEICDEEKKAEEESIHNELAFQFLLNRSARRIQFYWREYQNKKQMKKKGKAEYLTNVEFKNQYSRIMFILNNCIEQLICTICFSSMIGGECSSKLKELLGKNLFVSMNTLYRTDDLENNEEFKNILENIFSCQPLLEYCRKEETFIEYGLCSSTILKLLVEFRNIMTHKLSTNGVEEFAEKGFIYKTFMTNETNKIKIKDLQTKLQKQTDELENSLKRQYNKLKRYQEEIELVKSNFQNEIGECQLISNQRMRNAQNKGSQKLNILYAEASEVRKDYNILLNTNLKHEKSLRCDRENTEIELANIITKFDKDIGKKHAEFENFKHKLNEEQLEVDKLGQKIKEEEVKYFALMEEKRIEEETIRNELLYKFLLNRAAKVIQHYWKEYMLRKAARKKKKGKGKGQSGAKKLTG